jgi:hypothetical protein
VHEKLQEFAASIRPPAYLPERMFPQLRERIGPAFDLIVEFSTLGEYRLDADGVLRAASALAQPQPQHPARPRAQRGNVSEREPQMGGAGAPNAARAAVRRIVAGGAAGSTPAATPAARRATAVATSSPKPRRPGCEGKPVGGGRAALPRC